jgi:hypothetical protein
VSMGGFYGNVRGLQRQMLRPEGGRLGVDGGSWMVGSAEAGASSEYLGGVSCAVGSLTRALRARGAR